MIHLKLMGLGISNRPLIEHMHNIFQSLVCPVWMEILGYFEFRVG